MKHPKCRAMVLQHQIIYLVPISVWICLYVHWIAKKISHYHGAIIIAKRCTSWVFFALSTIRIIRVVTSLKLLIPVKICRTFSTVGYPIDTDEKPVTIVGMGKKHVILPVWKRASSFRLSLGTVGAVLLCLDVNHRRNHHCQYSRGKDVNYKECFVLFS